MKKFLLITFAIAILMIGLVFKRFGFKPLRNLFRSSSQIEESSQPASSELEIPTVAGIVWQTDHETGNLDEWKGIWNNGQVEAKVSTEYAHSGQYSAALTIYNQDSRVSSAGTRLAVDWIGETADDLQELPDDAYYSNWFYFPQNIEVKGWTNYVQWKRKYKTLLKTSSDLTYAVNAKNREDGSMHFILKSHITDKGEYISGSNVIVAAPVNIPLNTWVHLECRYIWSKTNTGRITCWQDDQLIWDVQNIVTEFTGSKYGRLEKKRQWTVNNYASDTNPPTNTIYIDDAVISTKRIGPL